MFDAVSLKPAGRSVAPAALVLLPLSALPASAAAPSVAMFGSFFPAWLLCLFAGVIATVLLRVVFILIGLDDILQWRVPMYMGMALGLTFLFLQILFGR